MSNISDRQRTKLIAFGLFQANLRAFETYNELRTLNLSFQPHKITVQRWFTQFKRGDCKLEDNRRSGRPPTVNIPENEKKVREELEKDRRKTVSKLSISLGLKRGSVYNIVKKKLGIQKMRSNFTPHKLTRAQETTRVQWCKTMLEKFRENRNGFADRVFIGDEALFFECVYLGSELKWIFPNRDYPKQPRFNKLTYKKRVFTFF